VKLEVLPAKEGDCLILHSTGLIVIDGGPGGVAKSTLIPRLLKLREEQGLPENKPLVIDLLIVSHVDADHITGVIDLLAGILARKRGKQSTQFRIRELWHNSFDRILGNDQTGDLVTAANVVTASRGQLVEDADRGPPEDHAMVLASVKQGDDLTQLAKELGIPVNKAFGGALIQTDAGKLTARNVAGVELVVLGPRRTELIELQKEFEKWLKSLPASQRTAASLLAALDDESASNLSSIVLLARKNGKTILLTGDARGDKIIAGLEDNKLVGADQAIDVDILKMPHHGSIRNIDDHFVRKVTSGNYIFSGDGKHGNPDRETIDCLLKVRPGATMKFYLTYPIAKIDPRRKKEHDHERDKRRKKGKPEGPPWSDAKNALATVLQPPPAGVTVIEHTGQTMLL